MSRRQRGRGGGGGDDRRRLFVSGLLPECEDEDLVRYFSKFGRLDQASVCRSKDSDMSHCCGFVWMLDAGTAAAILEAKSEHRVWECPVQVSRQPDAELAALIDDPAAPPKKLLPRRVPAEAAPAPPAPEAEDAAEAADVDLGPDAGAVGEEGAEAGGSWRQQKDHEGSGWLFIGKLDGGTSEKDIQDAFSEAGRVQKVDIIRDKDGISKKFGFVRMADPAAADLILSSGQEFEVPPGNKIKVGPYTGKMKGGGYRGGGGGARGRDGGSGGRRDGWDRDGWDKDRDSWDKGSGGGRYHGSGSGDSRPSDARYARAPPPPPAGDRRGERRGDRGRDYNADRRGGAYTGGGAYVDDRGGGPVGGPIGGGGASRRSRPRERPQPYSRGGSGWR